MGRVLKIIMYLALLMLVYLWFSTVFKSCDSGSGMVDQAGDLAGEVMDEVEEGADDLADEVDEFFEDEEDINYEELDAEEDTDDEDIYEEVEPTPSETRTTTTTAPVRSSGSGRYMVIAGSYLIKSNAEKMRKKLAKMGYDAEVVVFDLSEYHSVSAGRFKSHESARSASRQLSGKGIDSYVHTRK